ncbi:MAG TPA: glycosyltransferase, partial [Gammaproteobacteria bacterium]|nr:glycosyltransferase [Gammaproteobacteria bacterium]
LGIKNRVQFHGPAKSEKKWEWIAGASVLVLPSRSENFGNVVLEAMAVGVPVVVTPEVGLADTVKRSGAGIVADGNPEAIAAAIKEIIYDSEKAHSMSDAGCSTVETKYTWDNVARQMEEVYQNIDRGQ